MGVDTTGRETKLPIIFDVTFPAMPCRALSLIALDASGKREINASTTEVMKVRLNSRGGAIGSHVLHDIKDTDDRHRRNGSRILRKQGDKHWRGSVGLIAAKHRTVQKVLYSATDVPNFESTVAEIRQALKKREGCRLSGELQAERMAGQLHVTVLAQNFYIRQRVFPTAEHINLTHIINTLGFGTLFPGIENPLDGFMHVAGVHRGHRNKTGATGQMLPIGNFKYFLKVVPTTYVSVSGAATETNQYSVTEYFSPVDIHKPGEHPELAFSYDISPITVSITEQQPSFAHFLTRLCAVLGGAFVLTGMTARLVRWFLQLTVSVAFQLKAEQRKI